MAASPPVLLAALNNYEWQDFLPGPLGAEVRRLPFRFESVPLPLNNCKRLPDHLRESGAEVLVSCWATPPLPEDLPVGGEGELRYVCHLAGSVKDLVPRSLIERGLKVTNWGGSVSRTVAECALLLVLSALRRSSYWAVAMHRDGKWKDKYTVVTASLFERSVGLHGFGAIARALVPLLKPFGVRISSYSPGVPDEVFARHGVERSGSLAELFAGNDIIVELAASTPETYHSVNEEMLRLIRPGGVFVNVGRGAIVDETALVRVAAEGRIEVALDVFEEEPLPAASPLRGMPNVTLLPHLGGPTKDRRRDSGLLCCHNLQRYLAGEPLEAEVTLDVYDRTT
ncbi:MAG TPA: hydroxyacid dehydrogenase [Terrimicrobiaceae bacterium]|nr:hydroxyacid dehydrogenase [Terrimicrobiaceae bacterium]